MGFGISSNNKFSYTSIKLEDLTKGLDPKKDKKKIEQIKVAFDFFNKPGVGGNDDGLDFSEQIAMLNYMNKADGDANERDGKVTRRGLHHVAKENGIGDAPKYKELKSFMDAYQKAIMERDPSDTSEIDYVRNKDGEFAEIKYIDDNSVETSLYTTDVESPDMVSREYRVGSRVEKHDQFGRTVSIKDNGVETKYRQYGQGEQMYTPTVIEQNGKTYTLNANIDDVGLYESDDSFARMGNNGILEPVELDDSNRITKEIIYNRETGYNDQYSFSYQGNADKPAVITVSKPDEGEMVYNLEGELYTQGDAENKQYFNYDFKAHKFTPAEAPVAQKPEIVKPQYQRGDRVHQTATWKNQRLGEEKAQKLGLNDLNTAEEALDKIISADENLKDKNINKEKLLADFIKNNPSVFVRSGESQGVIFSDAKWGRLDFPKDLSEYITE